jgi:hypothetical protein
MTPAQRQRKARKRRECGRAVLPVEVPLGPLADVLVDAGLLPEWDSENKTEVAKAVSRMIDSWLGTASRVTGFAKRVR